MPKVSVIIPMYNASAWIERCLASLFAQSLSEIEVLLIDDHSVDDSLLIARRYVELHGRAASVHFLQTPQNSGPAVARNIGLDYATGEYVAFVDADDWVEPDMYELLYQNAIDWNADISSASAVLDYSDGHHVLMHNPVVKNGEVDTNSRRYLLRHFISNFTTMLFRRAWLVDNGITFPLSTSGEDSCFMGQAYLMVRRICQVSVAKYHYVIHSSSISHRRGVYRGKQKRMAFRSLLDYARRHGVWSDYKWTLRWVYVKKAVISSWVDYLKSL
ncbi:MAG: glycosyltransferase [Paludibacteraceae bacterium]|nr:glycosyltransferase [Paludibacteraceae bacterium]MBO7234218.1 glycosyltransferase [Paludibacteraceae bacterium]MBO7259180.1 glycosyltransferase [Paludibacteraceae bacterium]